MFLLGPVPGPLILIFLTGLTGLTGVSRVSNLSNLLANVEQGKVTRQPVQHSQKSDEKVTFSNISIK